MAYKPIGADEAGNLPPDVKTKILADVKSVSDTSYVPAPSGGSAGQVLSKTSSGTAWIAPPSGGGGTALTKNGTTGMYTIGSGSSLTKNVATGMYPIGV